MGRRRACWKKEGSWAERCQSWGRTTSVLCPASPTCALSTSECSSMLFEFAKLCFFKYKKSPSCHLSNVLFLLWRDPERGWDRSKVKGLLANLITIRDVSYATGLEVVAGGRLYNIVVDTEVGGLGGREGGSCCFLLLTVLVLCICRPVCQWLNFWPVIVLSFWRWLVKSYWKRESCSGDTLSFPWIRSLPRHWMTEWSTLPRAWWEIFF